MDPATIASVDKRDEARVIATLVSAFIADPVERWLFAEPLQYLTQFPRFVAALGSGGFESETVFSLGDFAAVAIWMPPGAEADADAIVPVLSESVPAERQADAFSVLEQMDAAHPKDRHWYLPWLVSTVLGRELASARGSCSSAWREWTRITCRRSSKRQTRGRCRSMSATDSS